MLKKEDALARVAVSRETLYKYRQFPGGTGDGPEWLLKQIREEIEILEGIAKHAPECAEPVDLLIEAWHRFATQLKRKAH